LATAAFGAAAGCADELPGDPVFEDELLPHAAIATAPSTGAAATNHFLQLRI
jgi:hypothetical protein